MIHEPRSAAFCEGIERMRADGSTLTGRVQAIVVIEVHHAAPLISPAYDDGQMTEADMLNTHRARFAQLHQRRPYKQPPPGQREPPPPRQDRIPPA